MCEEYDGCLVCYRDDVKHDKLLFVPLFAEAWTFSRVSYQ
jgi:hypothetical protein